MKSGTIIVTFLLGWGVYHAMASVPTAEEYAHSLEARFLNGESITSIKASFDTNALYSIYEILPYCYDYSVDTNDLDESVARYKMKEVFLDYITRPGPLFISSNLMSSTGNKLWRDEQLLMRQIRLKCREEPDNAHWKEVYPKATSPYSRLFRPPSTESHRIVKSAKDFVRFVAITGATSFLYAAAYAHMEILNLENYPISRAELYAELSTNVQYNADAMFKYCLTEKSDFATNNIAIAEKQIWRNNFVLEIVTHSCNLHTNEANRALDTAYTNRLAILRAHYEAIPEPHLGMTGVELAEWRTRLGNSIDAYINGISPFRTPPQGE